MFSDFIKSDIDRINEKASWTSEQQQLFNLLISNKYNDIGIMQTMAISGRNKYYKLKKQVIKKIERIIKE